jgi:hypothetical protein
MSASVVKKPVSRSAVADLFEIESSSEESSELKAIFGNRKTMPLDDIVAAYLDNLSTASEEVSELRVEVEKQNRELIVAGAACRELKAELIDGEAFVRPRLKRLPGSVLRP